jgi:hypothetical protein
MGAKCNTLPALLPNVGFFIGGHHNIAAPVFFRVGREFRPPSYPPRRARQLRMLASISKFKKGGDREFWIEAARLLFAWQTQIRVSMGVWHSQTVRQLTN